MSILKAKKRESFSSNHEDAVYLVVCGRAGSQTANLSVGPPLRHLAPWGPQMWELL